MLARVNSLKLSGVSGVPVTVECEVFDSGIGIHLVGLADSAVKESLLRTVTALQANGYCLPSRKVVINIAPADLAKEGSAYDLPMALAIIRASGQDNGLDEDGSGNLRDLLAFLDEWLVVGELGLDGSVRAVRGCVQAVEMAIAEGCKGVIIPKANAVEVRDLFTEDDIPIYGVSSLMDAIASIVGSSGYADTVWELPVPERKDDVRKTAWDGIAGNEGAKRAVEIAAAGGHHLLLVGSPGSGKASLARAILDILPPMTREEALQAARIWSAAGHGPEWASRKGRPYRAPHHSSSLAALIGGGNGERILPGEVSLASGGVLHVDDFAEVPKSVKEALRTPMEDGKVTISRLRSKAVIPARFILVASMNPCPCGWYGEGDRCTCTVGQRQAYLARLGGPVYDMVDVQAWVHPVTGTSGSGESAADVALRVAEARRIQDVRYGDGRLNADLNSKDIALHCRLDAECEAVLERIVERLGLSALAYSRVLKVARTIADLAGSEDIRPEHLLEAAGYRFLDRRL